MAKIENVNKVVSALRDKAAQLSKDAQPSVAVGYTANCAPFVHENRNPKTIGQNMPRPSGLGFFWGPRGRPGFLLDVMRETMSDIRRTITDGLRRGLSMSQSLVLGGLFLQRESQNNVPVEYGNLRASAFTRLEE